MKIKALVLAIGLASSVGAQANIPVIDGAGLIQAVQQVTHMLDQIQKMQQQLETARQQFDSMNGIRGMADLINDPTARRYLPPSAAAMYQLYDGAAGGQYSGLSGSIAALKQANAVIDTAGLSQSTATMVDQNRNHVAAMQATAEAAFNAADQRFNTYQSLIQQLQHSPDPKSVMELQARIQAEQVMMQNEQTKLQMMNQLFAARQQALALRASEITIGNARGTPVHATFNPGGVQ